ncbi:arsenate-mycothiol transferase ArsC [Frondihabitans cladoniiphilus]|uniref:Phosphotyrosine protein phosphatase I domain-containing protein n=1 Tax=Frondihabitans cladoniiphilus TaxID=715785 RepID=A0ABP8VMF9_9MICO
MSDKPTVLFICQHNAGRSQLGAALLEHLAGDDYIVTSAGIAPDEKVNPAVAASIAELGMDISGRTPRAVTHADLAEADLVVLMKPGLALPGTPVGRVLEWSFPNPENWDVDTVRPLRDAIASRINAEITGPQR